MKNYIINLSNKFFDKNLIKQIQNSENVLIQLFCGEIEKLPKYVEKLNNIFPNAIIIGATTCGEIENSNILSNNTIACISIFKNTKLKTTYQNGKNEYEIGKKFIKELITPNTKAIIAFSDGLNFNAEKFLKGANEILNENITFAGGLAGDNSKFIKTFIVLNDKIYYEGIVGVSLNSDVLNVSNFYNFGWKGVGTQHIITKSKDNIVYEIDGIKADEFYGKYLGKKIQKFLPKTGIIFPLIVKRNGKDVARAVIYKNDDGSLVFGGELKEGEKVKIGIGKNITYFKYLLDFLPEGFFIYSCMARKCIAYDSLHKEIEPFARLAPTAGFFTYGEFFSLKKANFLNQTMTVLALSETKKEEKILIATGEKSENEEHLEVLWHLINSISQDYQKIYKKLQKKIENEIKELKNIEKHFEKLFNTMKEGVLILDKNFKVKTINKSLLNICELDKNMILNKNIDEIIIDFSKKIKRNFSFETTLKKGKEILVNFSKINENSFLVTVSDLSELKFQERQLLEQSKLAQMGEMINMIAHQWRQPLNTLSAIAIELEMKASMEILSLEEIENSSKEIQNIVLNMSNIINDFLNFAKNSNKKETFSINEIIDDMLKIIKAQFSAHNINIFVNIDDVIAINSYKSDILHIMLNLVSNARDALDERKKANKTIWINVLRKRNFVYIEVEDNAGGVESKIINRIFEPYFTTKEPGKGTGLGLYMSKKIARDRLKGDLTVKNTKNGAKFILKIPFISKG